MSEIAKLFGLVLLGIMVVVAVGLLLSLPVMFLWNLCLVGAVAGVQPIGWLQAWGLLILFGMLFKSTVSNSKS